MNQPGFMIYADDWENYISDYEPEEIGEMLKALLGYFLTGELTEFTDRGMRQFFRQGTKSIDFDRKRYDKKCLQNAYNRYRGVCKKSKIEPLSFEEWLTTVNDRREPLTKPTNINNQSPITNNQPPITNNQYSEGMQGERENFVGDNLRTDNQSTEDFLFSFGGYGK